ncbi:MAG: zinc-dependent metalloprotease [Actinomycetota bacterium]
MSSPEDMPFPPADAFADVPLLRELQRVMLAGSGPVNWELARQVGIAVASWSKPDPAPEERDREALEQTVRAAELAVADLTGLPAPQEVTRVQAVRRAEWVEANCRGLRGLFEPGAERLAAALSDSDRPADLGGSEQAQGLAAVMDRMVPLLMGAQVGVILGTFGQRVLGQYELPLPRTAQPALLFVISNMAEFEQAWTLDPMEFRAWVALHETTHAFDLARPWTREYLLGLVRELAEGLEFDLTALEERLSGLDVSDPQRLSEALMQPGDLLAQSLTDEQRLVLGRIQAFIAAAEGHADHVMAVVGKRMLRSYPQIEEAMRRRHEERSRDELMVEQLLGIELKREQYRLGRVFCDTVVEQTSEQILSKMWESPEVLPSMPELEEPRLWLARIA